MGLKLNFPKIKTKNESTIDPYLEHYHHKMIRYHLKKVLPNEIFSHLTEFTREKQQFYLLETLPKMEWSISDKTPSLINITLLCK